jgi:hypothetical protein
VDFAAFANDNSFEGAASGLPEKILDFFKIDLKNLGHFFQYSVS